MRCVVLPAHNPGPYTGTGTNTYFLPGRVPTLVDAGAGDPRHLDDVASALAGGRDGTAGLAQVLVTHAHVDHAAGAAALASRWPGARFAKWPWPERDARYTVAWSPIADNELVSAGDVSLWALHTPGHSPDHLCFFEPHDGLLFAGDLVVNDGTVMIPASHGGSLAQYLDSLRRILDLQPRLILPGHGRAIDQPAALLRGYIAHRLSRERQVLDALAAGPMSVAALVDRIYHQLDARLRAAASESVLAHLLKLRDESRAVDEPCEGGEPVWRLVRGSPSVRVPTMSPHGE